MSFLRKLFSPKKAPSSQAPAIPPPLLLKDPSLIRVHDAYARKFHHWRRMAKLRAPREHRASLDNPDELYPMILSALNDGFRSDVVKAARQLTRIGRFQTPG